MRLTKEEIANLAHLARLGVSEAELSHYEADLNRMMDLVDQMQAVNTDGVEPLAHPHEASQRLREDVVSEHNQREAFQAIAPEVEAGLFKVPKVIE